MIDAAQRAVYDGFVARGAPPAPAALAAALGVGEAAQRWCEAAGHAVFAGLGLVGPFWALG